MRATVLAIALVITIAPLARAQDAATSSDVPELLRAAVTEYDGGNYEEAYALFHRVHELQPSARSERALGKAAFELRRYRECVQWLEASLADQRSPLTDEMRTEVNTLLARARAFVGHFEVHVTANGAPLEGAVVDVDGAPSTSTTLDLDLGDHQLVAHAPGHADGTRRVSVHGGENETIELALVPAVVGGGAAVAHEDPGAFQRDLGWASVIAGGVFAIGGVVATALWANAVNNLNANVQTGSCFADPMTESVIPSPTGAPIQPTCLAEQSTYRTALPFMYVSYIGAGVLLATGLALVFSAPSGSSSESSAVTLRCSPFADVGASCQLQF
jgi:hypothetical protein